MEFLTPGQFKVLSNPGVRSEQLISPHNSDSKRLTITRVTVGPGAVQPRHHHPASEQTWLAIAAGRGELLLADERRHAFAAGEVVRFADGETHGFENTGAEAFVYLAVTSPPINFSSAYAEEK